MTKVYMNDEVFINKGFSISTDQTLLDIDLIYKYLDTDSYWANGIPFEKLERSIKNSLCFGLYFEQKQIGFARVVTDNAIFAYLADVFVLPEHRKKGLSKWLMQTIMAHPDLQGMRRWMLATVDAHGLYAQFGFTELNNPERWMQIFTPHSVAES